jgi:hypothetical protein
VRAAYPNQLDYAGEGRGEAGISKSQSEAYVRREMGGGEGNIATVEVWWTVGKFPESMCFEGRMEKEKREKYQRGA